MNDLDHDLDRVREMRADTPLPTQARLAPGRARLTDATRRRALAHRRLVLIPAGAAVLAASVVVTIAISGSGPTTAGRTTPAATSTIRVTLAAQVLNHASVTVATRHGQEPRPAQRFYTKFIEHDSQGTTSDENWSTFDDTSDAYLQSGHLLIHHNPIVTTSRTPLERFDSNATPAARTRRWPPYLRSGAAAGHHRHPAGTDPPRAFARALRRERHPLRERAGVRIPGADAVECAPATPPAAEASVYRAMATIPDISIDEGITDVLGRAAIGVGVTEGVTDLLIDPQTYQVIGAPEISSGIGPRNPKGGVVVPQGTVVSSMAWARVVPVSRPGRH